jgi:hypothetical protein
MRVKYFIILFVLGSLVFFVGCQEGLIGREVPVDRRIPLIKKGPQTGRWEAFEYAMNYKYLYTQPKDGAAGAMEFSGSVEKSAGGLDSLSISIYLLDGNGRIVAVKDIYDSGYKQRRMDSSFSVTLAPPPDTAGISFAHTAMASRGHK